MKNKAIKAAGAFILVSLVLVNISAFITPLQGQIDTARLEEFSIPISADPNEFISVWDTTETSSGSSTSNQVRLPLYDGGEYDFTVYWGDGFHDTITSWNQAEVTHTYDSLGIYTITITGTIVGWRFNRGGDRLKIIEIKQWGCLRLGNSGDYFYGCSNLNLTATDNLNLTGTTSLRQAFRECSNLGSSGDMSGWDTSGVTRMDFMFFEASSFNLPINNWDVSNVQHMSSMFAYTSFSQTIGSWNVSNVQHMSWMFAYTSFNQPIGDWDVSSVIGMGNMFHGATSFNQPIGSWDVSNVQYMWFMFFAASSFNQPIGNWDVSSVVTMQNMFDGASSFDQDIGAWDVSSVTEMTAMFNHVTLSIPNYDNLLIGWSQLTLQAGVSFHAGNSKYSNAAVDARQTIITNFGWTIIDGGLAIPGNFTLSSDAGNPDLDGEFWLNWTSSEHATNYSIYLYDDLLIEGLINNSYYISGVSSGTYEFHVVAFNDHGNQTSNAIMVEVDRNPQPFILSSTADYPDLDGEFWLNWTSSEHAVNYSIYLYDDLLIEGLINNSYYIFGVSSGTYEFHVVAFNDNGNQTSNVIMVEVDRNPQPFILSSTADYPDLDGEFWLNWTSSEHAVNYSIYLYDDLLIEGLINNSYYIFGVSSGTYEFHVVAFNDHGNQTSNVIMVEVDRNPQPFFLSSTAETPDLDGAFWLNWTNSENANNYTIYQNDMIIMAGLTNNSFYISGLPSGDYEYYLVAFNDLGDTTSNIIEIEVYLKPRPFTLITTAGIPDTDGIFSLIWTISIEANNYSVYRYSSFITEINGSLILLASEITDMYLALSGYSDGTYYFIVVAHNNYGDTLSNCIQVDVEITKTLTVINPDASSSWEPNSAQYINWTSTGNILNVKIELYRNGAFVMEIIASTPNDGIFYWIVSSWLVDSTNYHMKILDASDSSVFAHSDYFEIKTPSQSDPLQPPSPGVIFGYELLSFMGISILGVLIALVIVKKRLDD